jgi:hypothetical protein
MTADDRRPAEPVTFADGVLDPYRHVCAFVNERGEEDAVLDPFIMQGIDRGDRLLYLVDPAASAAPVNRLRHLGYDAGDLLEHHQCEVRTWTDTYLRGGGFDQAAMLFIRARHEHVVICSYDATRFDGSFIIDILRTHPTVLIGGMLQENPFVIPPSEFLEERGLRADH